MPSPGGGLDLVLGVSARAALGISARIATGRGGSEETLESEGSEAVPFGSCEASGGGPPLRLSLRCFLISAAR